MKHTAGIPGRAQRRTAIPKCDPPQPAAACLASVCSAYGRCRPRTAALPRAFVVSNRVDLPGLSDDLVVYCNESWMTIPSSLMCFNIVAWQRCNCEWMCSTDFRLMLSKPKTRLETLELVSQACNTIYISLKQKCLNMLLSTGIFFTNE